MKKVRDLTTSESPKSPFARLTLIVEYDEQPSDEELDDIIERARELGTVNTAVFETFRAIRKDLA